MIRRMAALEGGPGGTASAPSGANVSNGGNIPGANFIPSGVGGQVQITGALANIKVKDLFKSINFYR